MDLGLKFSEHAKELGAKSITAEVKEIYADEEIKEIMLKNGDTLRLVCSELYECTIHLACLGLIIHAV